jgi:hypothetical protein
MSGRDRDFAAGDAGAVFLTVVGVVGLATQTPAVLLLPVGIALGIRQVRRTRRVERELRAEQAARQPAGWMDRLSGDAAHDGDGSTT